MKNNIKSYLVARRFHVSGYFGFFASKFGRWRAPIIALSFYECRMSGGETQAGRDTQTLPVVIEFI